MGGQRKGGGGSYTTSHTPIHIYRSFLPHRYAAIPCAQKKTRAPWTPTTMSTMTVSAAMWICECMRPFSILLSTLVYSNIYVYAYTNTNSHPSHPRCRIATGHACSCACDSIAALRNDLQPCYTPSTHQASHLTSLAHPAVLSTATTTRTQTTSARARGTSVRQIPTNCCLGRVAATSRKCTQTAMAYPTAS